jgi:hypothetical protein
MPAPPVPVPAEVPLDAGPPPEPWVVVVVEDDESPPHAGPTRMSPTKKRRAANPEP